MDKNKLKKFLAVTRHEVLADLVVTNCNVVDVFLKKIVTGNVAICDGLIVGIGEYQGEQTIDGAGAYLVPGLIDAHIHLESTYLGVEQAAGLMMTRGTTAIIADPHEIVNVAGAKGMQYMLDAGANTPLSIKYMLPSCVPACAIEDLVTPFTVEDMRHFAGHPDIIGLGEMMDYPGLTSGSDEVLDKMVFAAKNGLIVDGHAPMLHDGILDGYVGASVHTDHECTTVEELNDRISRGMYVMLRNGSAAKDLENLLPGVNETSSRYCLLCSDDKEVENIINQGHLDESLRICVRNGIDPLVAIQMATINAAECYNLKNRGAIAPGRRADLVFFDNLADFNVSRVMIEGKIVFADGQLQVPIVPTSHESVANSMHVKDFSIERLKLHLKSEETVAMATLPHSLLTKKITVRPERDADGFFRFSADGLNKIAVIDRHRRSGALGLGLIKGFGLTSGALALTIAHDSHHLIVIGASDRDMAIAIDHLVSCQGGIVVVNGGKVIGELEMPIAGLMSDLDPIVVKDKLSNIHEQCRNVLGIREGEPLVKLSFMALPVIPEIKMTPKGLFDVSEFKLLD